MTSDNRLRGERLSEWLGHKADAERFGSQDPGAVADVLTGPIPEANQGEAKASPKLTRDVLEAGEMIPCAVVEAICKAWPDQAGEILPNLVLQRDHYSFERWGMYVGVEFDGYIHT